MKRNTNYRDMQHEKNSIGFFMLKCLVGFAVVLGLIALIPKQQVPIAKHQDEQLDFSLKIEKEINDAEISPKQKFLVFLEKLKKDKQVLEQIRKSNKFGPGIDQAIEIVKARVEQVLQGYQEGFVKEQQSKFLRKWIHVKKRAEPVKKTFDRDGNLVGITYNSMFDVPPEVAWDFVELTESDYVLVETAKGMLAAILGEDHDVVKTFSKIPIGKMKYLIRIATDQAPQGVVTVQGTVKSRDETTRAMILVSDSLFFKEEGGVSVNLLMSAWVIFEETDHCLNPELDLSKYKFGLVE